GLVVAAGEAACDELLHVRWRGPRRLRRQEQGEKAGGDSGDRFHGESPSENGKGPNRGVHDSGPCCPSTTGYGTQRGLTMWFPRAETSPLRTNCCRSCPRVCEPESSCPIQNCTPPWSPPRRRNALYRSPTYCALLRPRKPYSALWTNWI